MNHITPAACSMGICEALRESRVQGYLILQDRRLILANAAIEEMTGYAVEALQGMTLDAFAALLSPDDRALFLEGYRRRIAGDPEVAPLYVRIIGRSDDARMVEMYPALATYNGAPALHVAVIDATERSRAARLLVQNEEALRLMFEGARDAIIWAEPETGTIVRCNRMAEELTGWAREELIGQSHWKLHSPEDRERYAEVFRRHGAAEATGPVDAEIVTRSGERRAVLITSGIVVVQGNPLLQGIFRDVTDEVAATEAMRAAHEELEASVRERTAKLEDANAYLTTVFETSHDGILVVDAEGRFEYGNPAFFRTFGWPEDELIGEFFMKVVPPDLHEYMYGKWGEVQSGRGAPYETEIVHKDGQRRALEKMCGRANSLYNVDCTCRISGDAAVRDNTVATHLYHIAREAVANAARHAGSRSIVVSLSGGERGCLTVQDSGTWLDRGDDGAKGVGLRIMRHRADIIGGELRIEHGEGAGTRVLCEFPNVSAVD